MKGSLFKILTVQSDISLVVNTLFEADNDAPVFYSSEMLEIWRRITGFEVILPTLYLNEVAIIALPMHIKSILHNVSFDGWDNLNVLRSKLCTATLEKEFWNQLLSTFKRVNLSCFSQNHQNFKSLPSIISFVVPRRKCLYIDVSQGWTKILEEGTDSLGRNVKQSIKRCEKEGVILSIYPSANRSVEEKIAGFKTACTFNSKRMSELGLESKFSDTNFFDYHKAVLLGVNNVFIVEAKTANNELIAWYYGFFNKTSMALFNGGYHGGYKQLSIGTYLFSKIIDYAIENRLTQFDFLRGNEKYKSNWTNRINQNESVYLSKATPRFIIDLYYRLFNETRHRMGSWRAIKLIATQVFSKSAV